MLVDFKSAQTSSYTLHMIFKWPCVMLGAGSTDLHKIHHSPANEVPTRSQQVGTAMINWIILKQNKKDINLRDKTTTLEFKAIIKETG